MLRVIEEGVYYLALSCFCYHEVPGEGLEPSRAEAQRILSPSRLPIPPPGPHPTSQPAQKIPDVFCVGGINISTSARSR